MTTINSEFAEVWPSEIDSVDEIEEAFRNRVTDYHPDQGGNPEEFKKFNNERERLKEQVEREGVVEVEGQSSVENVSLTDSLDRGIETYLDENGGADYEVLDGNIGDELHTAVIADQNSALKIGLELDYNFTQGEERIDIEATYFADGFGELETHEGHADLRDTAFERLGYDEWNKESGAEANRTSLEDIGAWSVRKAEEEVKPNY